MATQWVGRSHVKGSTEAMRMVLLTTSLIGLQFTWGVEMTYCTPYLLQLGLTKSRTSLVWIAGPLSGLIMQPIVGVIADRSTSRYGRRRPFMVVGSFVVAVWLLVLGWTKEIVELFVDEGDFRTSCTIVVAVLSIYAVDFAINAASRMVAVGHLAGYIIGTLDLVRIFGTSFGDTQFKKLTLMAALGLIITVGVTSWAVTERVLVSSSDDSSQAKGIDIIRQIFRATKTLPPRIQAICNIQLWSWIGWFPFMFYSTTFVGEIYFRSPEEDTFTHRPPSAIAETINTLQKYKPDLLSAWVWGHVLFSSTMALAPLARSFRFATSLVALCGLPWTLASWAPNTYLGIEVNRLSSNEAQRSHRRVSVPDSMEMGSRSPSTPSSLRLRFEHMPANEPDVSTGELSGLYFGILNIYTTIPQFIGTFISMIVFGILEPGKSPELSHDKDPSRRKGADGPNAISVCLFIGAISTVGATFATRRLKALQ